MFELGWGVGVGRVWDVTKWTKSMCASRIVGRHSFLLGSPRIWGSGTCIISLAALSKSWGFGKSHSLDGLDARRKEDETRRRHVLSYFLC